MEYIYTRNKAEGKYDINNFNRVEAEGNPIYLAKEVEQEIYKKFKIICNLSECKIIFEEELTNQEKEALDIIVENHQNNI